MISIQRKNYVVVMMILMVFSFNLTAADSLNEGIFYLNKAKRAKALQMNQTDITGYLNKAYFSFQKSKDSKAKFLQIYVGQMIGMNKESQKTAEKIVRESRKEYINLIAGINWLSNDEKKSLKNFILMVEEKIPFLENIGLKKEVIFPYQGEKPEFHFNLNQVAKISFSIDSNIESSDNFKKGENVVGFNWKETFFDKKSLRWELNSLNDFAGDSKAGAITFDIKMPDLLSYSNNTFEIKDKKFKDEKKMVKKLNPNYLFWAGLGAVIGILAITHPKYISPGVIDPKRPKGTAGLVICVGSFLMSSIFPKKSQVPHQENIAYNKELSRQIEEKKKEIMIKLNLENN